jgi:hypothetical protein
VVRQIDGIQLALPAFIALTGFGQLRIDVALSIVQNRLYWGRELVADQAVFDNISASDALENSLDHNFTTGALTDVRHHRQVTERAIFKDWKYRPA